MLHGLALRLIKAVCAEHELFLVKLVVVTQISRNGETLSGVDIAVQACCTLTAGVNGVNGEFRTCYAVAADEYIGLGGLIGNAVAYGGILFADFDLLAEVDITQEIYAADNVFKLLACNSERSCLLCADCEVEALVALLTKLSDGDILK